MAKKEAIFVPSWVPVLDYSRENHAAQQVLERFCEKNMVHAYLITGSKGIGKLTLAKTLACGVFCTSTQKPCFHCDACQKVLQNNHPDVLTVFPEKGKTIGVEPIRALIRSLNRYSISGGWRVALIEPVDKMSQAAQNILLKTLEEPLPNIVMILMAHEPSAAIGTIASRCSRVKLLPRSDETLFQTLCQCGFASEKIKPVLKLCSGNIGLAVRFLTPGGEASLLPEMNRLMSCSSMAETLSLLNALKDSKDQAQLYLTQLEEALHRCLLVASGCGGNELISDLPDFWQTAALKADYAAFDRLLQASRLTSQRLQSQVNWQSNLDMLVMEIMEEVQKWKRS